MTFPTPASSSSVHPQAFRAWLSNRSTDELAEILRNRPDAAVPLPAGFSPLATRLLLRSSISRALSLANAQEIARLEEISQSGGELKPVEVVPDQVLASLKSKALVYGDDLVMVPGAVMSALPTGFSVLKQNLVSPGEIQALKPQQRKVLEALLDTGLGTTRDASPDADPTRPVPQLLAAGLLERVDLSTVRLPRSVRDVLKGVDPVVIPLMPSGRAGVPQANARIDAAGAAAGLEVVRLMGSLLEILGQRPVELLKDKSVGVRQVSSINKQLDTQVGSRLIDLGFQARLLSRGEPEGGPEGNFLAPTEASTQWLEAPLRARLEFLQEAWLGSPWAAWQSTRALDSETSHDFLPLHRKTILDIYRNSSVPLEKEEFLEDLRFSRPLFALHTQSATIDNLVEEAQWLGVVAHGAITQSIPVPEEVSHFIVQADMTVLAPGPLASPVSRRLEGMADVESPGLASVYRITAGSIRRGLDSGYTAAELKDFLDQHSLAAVPQSIHFAIDDAARNHGSLRAGPALSYLRCEDEPMLAQAVSAVSCLRLLAPTVAVSDLVLGETLAALREAGFSPAAEDASGATITVTAKPALLPTPRAPIKHEGKRPDPVKAAASIIAADTAPTATDAQPPAAEVLSLAARSQQPVVIGYADRQGRTQTLNVTPLSVSGGQVDAIGPGGKPVRIPVPRITDVQLA